VTDSLGTVPIVPPTLVPNHPKVAQSAGTLGRSTMGAIATIDPTSTVRSRIVSATNVLPKKKQPGPKGAGLFLVAVQDSQQTTVPRLEAYIRAKRRQNPSGQSIAGLGKPLSLYLIDRNPPSRKRGAHGGRGRGRERARPDHTLPRRATSVPSILGNLYVPTPNIRFLRVSNSIMLP